VVEVSEGALGDVDCCFEHATIASALKHNKSRLRFIEITSLYSYLSGCLSGGSAHPGPLVAPVGNNAWSQAAFRRSISPCR
jgi:hypothetical protein